jgi:uncharacterized protein
LNPTQPPAFVDVLKGNPSKLLSAIGGGLLVFVVWQISVGVAILLPAFFDPAKFQALLEVVATAAEQGTQPDMGSILTLGQDLTPAEEARYALTLMIAGFGPGFLALMAWRKLVEKRAVKSLFTQAPRFRWGLALGAIVYVIIAGALAMVLDPGADTAGFDERAATFVPTDWALIIAAYAAGACVQATFEEVFIRGWLLQQLSRVVSLSWLGVVLSAVVFAALHYGYSGWATYAATFLLGLVFGWSALRLNGLEAAIGAHIGNNVMSAALLGTLVAGNPATMDGSEMVFYLVYALGFVGFVECWVRFGPASARAARA